MEKLENLLESLWKKSRFCSYFFHGIDLVEDSSIPSLALGIYSSRMTLFFNPDFIARINDEELTGLLVHEMLHVILDHDHRGEGHGSIYMRNLAQDMVINSYIHENSELFFSRKNQYLPQVPGLVLPAGLPVIPEDFFAETGNSDPAWEEVYGWLTSKERAKIMIYSFNEESGNSGDTSYAAESPVEQMRDALNSLDLSYNTAHDRQTTSFRNMEGLLFEKPDGEPVPTGMHLLKKKNEMDRSDSLLYHFMSMVNKDEFCRDERIYNEISGMIESTKKSDRTWQRKIRSMADITSQSSEFEYTYHRFNRRYFASGIYSPGRSFKYMQAITVVVDVSGSMVMKPGDIEAAFGIVEELADRFRVFLLCIDETVFVPEKNGNVFIKSPLKSKPYEYRKGDWKHLQTGSSGTTFFEPLFNDYMKGHKELLIVITDGYIYDMEKLMEYRNTLWLISENRTEPFHPPFGKTVKIESAENMVRLHTEKRI